MAVLKGLGRNKPSGMNMDFSWDKSAEKYMELYKMAKEMRG